MGGLNGPGRRLGRLGVLGGTFDPPHRMHLSIAQAARAQMDLTRVLFVPAGDPWRKADRRPTPAAHRLAMTALAVAAEPACACSDIEVRRRGPSYTLDTLQALSAQGYDRIWFVLGSDALTDLPHWHEPQRLIAAARLAVAVRPGAEIEAGALDALIPGLAARVDWVHADADPLSATALRRRLAAGEAVAGDAPPAVADYARRRRLYT